MKKLLTILITLIFSAGCILAQNLSIKTAAYVYNDLGGKVAVSMNQNSTPSNWGLSCEEELTKKYDHLETKWGIIPLRYWWYGYKVYYFAKADTGYTLEGWSKVNNTTITDYGSPILVQSTETIKNDIIEGTAGKTTTTAASYYAHFKPIISFNPDEWVTTQDLVRLVKDENGEAEDKSVTIHLYKAEGLTYNGKKYSELTGGWALSSNSNIKYKLEPKSNTSSTSLASSDPATGQYTLTINADNADRDETGTIQIATSNNGGYVEISVVVTGGGAVQFIHNPQVTYNVFDRNNVKKTISKTITGSTSYYFYNGIQNFVTLELDPTSYDKENYIVARWIIDRVDGENRQIIYRYNNPQEGFTLVDGDIISVEIVRKTNARYSVICGGDSVFYYNLQEAINVAQASDDKVVYVSRSGKVPYREGGYTILNGVTLLVSGEGSINKGAYGQIVGKLGKVPRIGGLDVSDFTGTETSSNFPEVSFASGQYLELEDGTIITVNGGGNLCVHSELSSAQQFIGMPYAPGILKMGQNCNINLESGAKLMAYGFITAAEHRIASLKGQPISSKIIAKTGSEVYEVLQIRDWPGGVDAASMKISGKGVFPFGQYYIQNIETVLRIEQGATEYLSGCISISSSGGIIITEKFISEDAGFLQMTENAVVEKYYDWYNDRLHLGVYSENNTNPAQAKLGEIKVKLKYDSGWGSVLDMELKSSEFILPINMNTDISLNNAHVTNKHPVAMLAGATLSIDNKSKLTLDGDLYVYDFNQHPQKLVGWQIEDPDNVYNNWGFYYSQSAPINNETPVIVRSNGATARIYDVSSDAKIDVNGQIFTTSTGTLYTTGKTKPDDNKMDPTGTVNITDGGANITSSLGGGKISFENTSFKSSSFKSKTYQRNHKAGEYFAIDVTSAKLLNGDGTYETTMEEATTFTYSLPDPNNPTTGKWEKPDNITYTNTVPAEPLNFVFNVPNVSSPATKSATITINFTGSSDDVTFSIDKTTENGITIGTLNYIIAVDKNSSILEIPVSYTQSNVDGDREATFTITTNKPGLTIPPFTVKVSENYDPEFSCSIDGSLDIAEFCNTKTNVQKLNITPGNNGDNVTSLLNTSSNLEWSFVIEEDAEDNFDFTFGDAANLSGAQITFNPKSAGTKTATLKIIATSNFVATGQSPLAKTVEVPLSGTANLCPQQIELHNITQLFVGEENVALIADPGNGNNISIQYDSEYIELSPASGTDKAYTIKALKAGKTKIKATQAEYNGYASSEAEIEITILDAVTWNWDVLYYGATHTDPLIVDTRFGDNWSLTLEDDRPELSAAFSAIHPSYTMSLPMTIIEGDQQVKFMFRSGDIEIPLLAELSDLRILTACVENKKAFDALTLGELDHVEYSDGAILFKSTESNISTWTAQFYGTPSTVEFTPYGTNIWRIEQATTSGSFTAISQMDGVHLTAGEKVTLPLNTDTRYVKFTYGASDNLTPGRLEGVCIHRLDISATPNVVYLPLGETREVIVRHTCAGITTTISPNTGLTCTSSTPVNRTDFNETTLTLTATAEGRYTVTATENITEGKSTDIQVIAYKFPMGLPIIIDDWTQANGKEDYYNFYVDPFASANVRWEKNTNSIVFGFTALESNRRTVVFAFEGSPSVLKFNYEGDEAIVPDDWTVEESTDGKTYQPAEGSIQIDNKDFDFVQKLKYTTRYVCLSQKGAKLEKKLSNLIIEGYPSVILDPTELLLSEQTKSKTFTLTAINLQNIKLQVNNPAFTLQYQYKQDGQNVWSSATTDPIELKASNNTHPDALGINKVGDIVVKVTWAATASVSQGLVTVSNLDGGAALGTVKLVGAKEYIESGNTATGIWTGIPVDGEGKPKYELRGGTMFKPYTYHQVDVKNAFVGTQALFDYLVIYGETTTSNGDPIIYEADRSRGSNALTPYYIYKKEEKDTNGDGVIDISRYKYHKLIDNANSSTKGWSQDDGDPDDPDAVVVDGSLSMYITGFCPYATTGCTRDDEGVWYFKGPAGSRVDVYLEDCHLYSRNKSVTGQKYGKNDNDAPDFTEGVVQGSGAVLIFEHWIKKLDNVEAGTFDVAIHTIGDNMLKSNYGAYFNLLGTDQGRILAAQVSASVQVRLGAREHFDLAEVVIDFDDKWPNAATKNSKGEFTSTYRTNGFLSLQKQANHAPSIDLGNTNTIVNFRGGRVELQNAEIVSPNYKTTFAISHRSGIMGNIKDFPLAYGIGTDDVGGTVNFYDGTTTVIPMEVDGVYQDFYLMDEDRPNYTSCLRTPANTFIYGGSHCMIRACKYVTSKGGAPTDGVNPLGLFEYTLTDEDDVDINKNNLVTLNSFPDKCYAPYYQDQLDYGKEEGDKQEGNQTNYPDGTYGKSSVAAVDGKLNLWLPDLDCHGFEELDPEVDKELLYWLACMTEIQGGGFGIEAHVGGDIFVDDDDEIRNLLYCQLDDYIYDVISALDPNEPEKDNGDPNYKYLAPAKAPTDQFSSDYFRIGLTSVSDYKQHNIIRESDYEITNQLYYVTPAKADTWMNFTMPFDVAKVWIVEACDESQIVAKLNEYKEADKALTEDDKMADDYLPPMEKIKMFQAEHNADFASFFAMAMAIGTYGKDFDQILEDYMDWAKTINGDNRSRVVHELEHYDGSNFTSAHYYLYKNMGNWTLTGEDVQTAQWEVAPSATENDGILMNKGETYSMLFPYCTGCDVQLKQDENGQWVIATDEKGLPITVERDYWDYWSGKLLIFESTVAPNKQPHIIKGTNYTAAQQMGAADWIFDGVEASSGYATLMGNATFSEMNVKDYNQHKDNIFTYNDEPYVETFQKPEKDKLGRVQYATLVPTESFLVANYHKPIQLITRNGRVITDDSEDQDNGNQGTTTGGHMPTVGGGNDMFITGTDNGINVAVASPQMVYVVTTTGAVIYSGYVESNINIPLPMSGIYIVKGENEVQKIFY